MKNIPISLGDRSYSITIGSNILPVITKKLSTLFPHRKIVIVTNKTLARLYRKKMDAALGEKFDRTWIVLPDGERYKSLKTIETIYDALLQSGANRQTGIIAFGGGVVGDMAGFAAATFLRGVPYIQWPTTLLAQVDSSVGGKTGVDLPEGKNLVGAFYQPSWVAIDTAFLKTLPAREFRCGLAEVVKYGLLADESFFRFLEKNVGKILCLNHNALTKIIATSCRTKAAIVSTDERESGLRALLNLGHTLGHAVETLSGYNKIRHGEAVSLGLHFAARLSCNLGYLNKRDVERTTQLLKSFGLPTKWPSYSKKDYRRVLAKDKKNMGAKIKFVALKKIGKAFLLPLTVDEILENL